MKVRLLRDGGCAILDGEDLIELNPLVYEVLYCAIPIDPQSLHDWLTGSLLTDPEDRAMLGRIVGRLGGVSPAMEGLQAQLKALPPPGLAASGEADAEPPPEESPEPPAPTAPPVRTPARPTEPAAPLLPRISAHPTEPAAPRPGARPTPAAMPAPDAPRTPARPAPTATPKSDAPKKPARSPAAQDPGTPAGDEKILSVLAVIPSDWTAHQVVDQLRDSRFRLQARLVRVEDALEAYRRSRADLVILDLGATGAQDVTLAGGSEPVRRFLELDPNARIVVTYSIETKSLLLPALRAGASGQIAQPFDSGQLRFVLVKALTSRSWAPAPSSSTVRTNLACAWKASGLLRDGEWEEFVAHVLDLRGVEGSVDGRLKPGAAGRLRLRLTRLQDALEVPAQVESWSWDAPRRCGLVRFKFVKIPLDAVDRLSSFLAALRPKRAPGA